MTLLYTLFIGIVGGWAACMIINGKNPGFWKSTFIGLIGYFLGKKVLLFLNISAASALCTGLAAAIIGSMLVIGGYAFFRKMVIA